jgi:hypothetical protein
MKLGITLARDYPNEYFSESDSTMPGTAARPYY